MTGEIDRLRIALRELLDAEKDYRVAYVGRKDAKFQFDRLKAARQAAAAELSKEPQA